MPYLQQYLQVFTQLHDSEENYTFIQQSQKQKMHAVPDHSTVYIEYCRACDTHSWCTHHDEGKYLSYFDKLATMINNEFPDINVVGNKIPAHLTPLTGYDNKFYNSKTKKYINFPAIGAFEVVFCGQTIFSKKKTNAWPELFEIKKQIKSVLVNGQEETTKNAEQSNNKSLQVSDEEENNNDEMATDKQTITFATNQYMDNDDVRTTFYKPKQAKSFTLTDHFKIYKMQKKQNERVSKDNDRLEKPLSKVQVRSKKWEEISLKNPLSNFLKERAYINQEKGKREMIIDLHSIEQEVFAEENCVSKRQRGLTRNNLENRAVMKQWDQQLNFLEHKFRKVESSLSKIKEKNKQFDSSIELEWLNRINQHKQYKQNQPNKEHVRMPCLRHSSHSPLDQPKSQKDSAPNYLPAKLVKIDKYINSSQAYKNKKLHEIYGQWKIIKRNLNPVEPRYLSKRKQYTFESQSDEEENNGRKKRKTQRKQRSNERDEKQLYRFESQHDTQFPNIENKNKKFTQTMRQPYKLGGALQSINAEKLTGKSGRQTPSHEKISNDRKITNKSPNWNTDAVRFVDRNYQIKMKSPQAKQDDIESIKTSTKQNRFFTTDRCNRSYKQNEKNKQNSKDKLKKPLNHLYKKIGERNKMMQIQIENGKDEQQGKQKSKQKKQSEAVSIRTQKKGKMNVLKQKVKQQMGNSKQDKMRKERIKKIKELKQQKINPDDIYKLKYRGSLENQQPEQKQEDKQIDHFFKGRFSDEEDLSQQGQKDDCELIQERSDENQAKQQQPEDLKDEEFNCSKQEGKCGQTKEIAKAKINQKQVSKHQKETKNKKMVRKNEQKLIKQKEKKLEKQKKDKVKNNQDKPSTKIEQKEDEKPQKKQLQIERLNQLGANKKVDKENSEKKKGQNQVLKNLVSKNSKVHSEPLDSKSQRSQNHAINKLKGIKKDRISGDTTNNDKEQTKQFQGKIDEQGRNSQQKHLQQELRLKSNNQDLNGEKTKEKEQLQDTNLKDDTNQKLITSKQTENPTKIKNIQNSGTSLNNKPDKEKLNQLQTKDEQHKKFEHHEISNTEQQKEKAETVQFQNKEQRQQSKQIQRNTENFKQNGQDQDGIQQERDETSDQMPESNKLSQQQSQQWKKNEQSKFEPLQDKQKLEGKGDYINCEKKKQQNINSKPEQRERMQQIEDKEIYQAAKTTEKDKKEDKLKIVQICENADIQPFQQTNLQEKEQQNQQRSGNKILINQFEQKKELSSCREQGKSLVQLEKANKLENDIADNQKEQSIANREEDEDEGKIKKQSALPETDQILTNLNENQKLGKEQQLTNQIRKFEERGHTGHQPDHNHKSENTTQEPVKDQYHRNISNSQDMIWYAFYKETSFCLQGTIRNPHDSEPKAEVNSNKQESKRKEIEQHSASSKTSIKGEKKESTNKQLVGSKEREDKKNRQQNQFEQVSKTEESDKNKQKIDSKTEVKQSKMDSQPKMQEMPSQKDGNTKIEPMQQKETNNKALDEKKQAKIENLEQKQEEKEQEKKEKQGKQLKAESDELKQQVSQKEETKSNGIQIETDENENQIEKLEQQNGKEEQEKTKEHLLETENQENKNEKMVINDKNCQKVLQITDTDKDRSEIMETYASNKKLPEDCSHNKQMQELVKEYKKIESEDIKLVKEEVNKQVTRLQALLLASYSEQDNNNKSYKNINNVENLATLKNQDNKKEQTNLNTKQDQQDYSKQDKQSIKGQQSEILKAEKEQEQERVDKNSYEEVEKEQNKQSQISELTNYIQQFSIKSNETNNKQSKSDQMNEQKLVKGTEQKQLQGKQEEYKQRIKQMQKQESINKQNKDNFEVEQKVEDNNKQQQQTDANKRLIQQEGNRGELNEHLKQQNIQKIGEERQQSLVKKQKQQIVDEQQNEENHVDKQQVDVEVRQKKEENYKQQQEQILQNKQQGINEQQKTQICDQKIVVQNKQAINNKICNDGQDQPLQKKILNPRPDLDLQKYHGNGHQLRQSLKHQSSINSTEKHLLSDKDNIYFQQKKLTSTPEFVIPQPEKISVGTQKNDVSDFGLQTGMLCQKEVFLSKNNSRIEESLRKDQIIINGYKMSSGESQVTIMSLKKTDEDKIHERKIINNSIEKPEVKNGAEKNKLTKQKQYENKSFIGKEQDRKIQRKQQITAQQQQLYQKPKKEGQRISRIKKEKKVSQKTQKIDKNKSVRKQKNKEQSQCEQSDLERAQNNHDSNVNQEKLSSQLELKVKSQIASSRLTQIIPPNDSTRALIIKQLYGAQNQTQINIFNNESSILSHTIKMDSTLIDPKAKLKPISKIRPECQLVNKKDIKLNQLLNFNQLNNLHKALLIVGSINTQLITRLFQNPFSTNHRHFGVWLCDHFIWKCFVFDATVPVNQKQQPFYNSSDQQIWPLILQKALAIYAQGYDKINDLQISKILHLLTGSNVLSYKIRQDPTKNHRLYSSIKKCLQKNYFVYCHKHDFNEEPTSATYQLENIRKANNDEIVVHLKETKDGKENKFWIKSEKFIQEFKSVDIVLLRQNSNNCRLSLKNQKGTFSIVCLDFEEDAQGSITISNKLQSGSIKVFLYREQASNTLKLVGEAKEKDKNQLFFDCSFTTGKYYVFIETQCCESTMSYTGESRPSMYLKQQIKAEGYKNDFTQYLPISKGNKQNSLSSRLKRLDSKNQSLAKSKKPMSQVNIDILKQTFVRFLAATATQQAHD